MQPDNLDFSAYYSLGLCGFEIAVDETGTRVYYRFVGMTGPKPVVQQSKVYSAASGRRYFRVSGRRIYLDKCMRRDSICP